MGLFLAISRIINVKVFHNGIVTKSLAKEKEKFSHQILRRPRWLFL